MPESITQKTARRLGSVKLSPMTPVVAGAMTSWTIELTVGSAGIDEGGTIKIAQRFASDGEDPQFTNPAASGYSSVHIQSTDPNTRLRPRFDRKGHDRPYMAATVIDVYDGSLAPGDKVTLILGDRSQGSPGIRAQSFQEARHEFRVFVDPTNACLARGIPTPPTIPIIPGKPVELLCIVPTHAQLNTPTPIHLKTQDQWGNPLPAPADTTLTYEGTGIVKIENRKSKIENILTFTSPGSGRIVAKCANMQCSSNPISTNTAPLTKFWGDLHAQSDATVGTGSEEEYFTFARDWAFLDFCSHQGNDFQVRDEDWKKLNDTIRQFHQDHHFVIFPGFEWSGNSSSGGDRNVWYLEEDMPIFRSSHWQVPHIPENDLSPAETANDLFKRCHKFPGKVLIGAHVGGRFADLRKFFDPTIGQLVEINSCWGIFEWMLWDAFDHNHIIGIVCTSDGHKGRPGAEGPGAGQFGMWGGLTCVLAKEKTRAAIWDALTNRRCYGTTGPRIDIDLTIDNHPIGSIINNTQLPHKLAAKILATAPIESIEIYQGKTVIHTWQPAAFKNVANSNHIRISWKGSRIRGRGRRANWDGKLILEGGTKILSATAHFDAPIDQILATTGTEITFKSQTTGDADWIDLILSDASKGTLTLDSKVGKFTINLADLTTTQTFPAGGLDMEVKFQRYPASLSETVAEFALDITPPASPHKTPYFLKVTQSDGHLAWTSPIYL
ncbi:MAG: DUF3604 domain-containing protein [Phycisphaerales bacterium]|nr:DUF3604 domain-containing protein [Phycisphaerales bacterium]